MPKQLTLATQAYGGFERHRKPTRRDIFLAEMDQVVPWAALCALIEPFYPKPRADGGGRPPVGLERMLRIHFLQQWYALSDPAVEEALYDSAAMRRFVGIDLGRESATNETTVCKFRHLLEKHGLAERVFKAVSQPGWAKRSVPKRTRRQCRRMRLIESSSEARGHGRMAVAHPCWLHRHGPNNPVTPSSTGEKLNQCRHGDGSSIAAVPPFQRRACCRR